MKSVLALFLTALSITAAAGASRPRVRLGEPVLVTEAPAGERRWGRYQFPTLYPIEGGGAVVFVHVAPDAAESYGLPQLAFVSRDHGATWAADEAAATRPYGLRLPNGDRLLTHTLPALRASSLALPPRVSQAKAYGMAYDMYRLRELPPEARLIFFRRFPHGGREWTGESTELDDPDGLRPTVNGLLPRIWWGDMRVARDGSLVAVVYPSYVEADGRARSDAACYRSADAGKTWRMQGRIAYQPDLRADPRGHERTGFTEPGFEILKDGSLFAALRTEDGTTPRGPMYFSRSRDMGKTWTKPAAFTKNGVLPRLLLLDNGTLVLSCGRPGLDLRFSRDSGKTWSEPYPLVPLSSEKVQDDSCGYSDLLPIDRNTFLVVYSWFKRPGQDGQTHKAILVRRVEVE